MEKSSNEIAGDWRCAFFDVLTRLGATPHKGATDSELSTHFSLPIRVAHARRFELLQMGIVQPSRLVRPSPWNAGDIVWELSTGPAQSPEDVPPKDGTHCDRDYSMGHHYHRTVLAGFCSLSDTTFHPSSDTISAGRIGCWGPCGKTVGSYCYHHPMYGLSWALEEHQEG